MSETKFQKTWKDPVWSKVISAAIIGLLTILYNIIIAIIENIDFITAFNEFWTIEIPLWTLILVLAFVTVIITINSLKRKHESTPENKFLYDENSINLDKQLFNKIRNELITQENIRWLKINNFAGFSFYADKLQPFDKFEYEAKKSDFEFLNPEIEKVNIDLKHSVENLSNILSGNIFSEGDNRLSVPSEWEVEQPERFWKAVDEIHAASQNVGNKYDELIKIGRRILKI